MLALRVATAALALVTFASVPVRGFLPQAKLDGTSGESLFGDDLLRQVVERMGQDLAEAAADAYLDIPSQQRQQLRGYSPSALALGSLKVKQLEAEAEAEEAAEAAAEEEAAEEAEAAAEEAEARRFLSAGGGGPLGQVGPRGGHPMTRDREYLQHSSLWGGRQYPHGAASGGPIPGKMRLKPAGVGGGRPDSKSDAVLPAYCNPPNPCPIGYTESDGCLETFENTASFSRDFQANQDCMCDSEHMFKCPGSRDDGGGDVTASAAAGMVAAGATGGGSEEGMASGDMVEQHKSLVAKKFHVKKDGNPFLRGEKLPVAAKKGINVGY
ncbi:neuroendocrine protein 7B2 [Hetaerina americana]|uniref:neuroendocrine protein 7B2 n=1 Tax=Hetaerina americana TaxID=62018 RepID=UPI003A7F3D65